MAIKLPCCGDGEHPVAMPPADGSAAGDNLMWKHLKRLNDIVFCIEFLEYSGNAIGTVAFLGATVVLLGGFRSLLSPLDFWFAAVMIFMEGTRVFIGKDTSVNQWLFGSTRAFRWDHFCFSDMHDFGNLFAVIIGAGISLAPIEFGSQIITSILKVATLAITSLLLARRHWNCFAKAIIALFLLAGACGSCYGFWKLLQHKSGFLPSLKSVGALAGPLVGAAVVRVIIERKAQLSGNPKRAFWIKVIVASGLVCLPALQAKLGSNNKFKSLTIWIAPPLITVHLQETVREQEQSSNALLLGTWQLLLKIVDTIMPILFFWSVLFPLPGISLKLSFYMLLSVIAAVLVGNLQIPVAFLQILLSGLRLHSLLAGRDYHSLPDGASPNMVPSIVVFYVLELCQGSTNILGIIIGLISFRCRRKLVRVLGLKKQEWGAKAVNLYYHQACMTIKEKGLFPMEKSTPPSLDSFAVESLGCTSSEMQIVRLQVLDYYLQQEDSKSKSRLIAQIANDAKGIVTKIAGTISHLITDEEINSGNDEKVQQIRSSLSVSVNFVKLIANADGENGTRIREELKANRILAHSLQHIVDLQGYDPQELRTTTRGVNELLA